MKPLIQCKPITLPLLIAVSVACFALMPQAEALTPAPDGGYTGWNTAEGQDALFSRTTGDFNTAIGGHALYGDTTGNFNTAVGAFSLAANSSGDENVAVGQGALRYNTTGIQNAANGFQALYRNTIGFQNTASGSQALYSNTTGGDNTANGAFALFSNINGFSNCAFGGGALQSNTGGFDNSATGAGALFTNTNGNDNTADGYFALYYNTTGGENTAIGETALFTNTAGNTNTAVGAAALLQNTIGNENVAVGFLAGNQVSTANNVTCLGANVAGVDVSNTTWIANVYGVTTLSGTTAPVVVSDNGQLGTVASSERFKKNIATMEKASEAIMSLRPVTFHYKTDTKGTPQFGLIAEEVAKVNPALVLPDKEGKPYTVRYEAVNAMLLNEFLKEHRKVEEQGATIAQLKQDFQSRLLAQQKQIESLSAGLQKVSAHSLEPSKPAPQMVNNP